MKSVFADTAYWIALANPSDSLHAAAIQVSDSLRPLRIFTTDEVLTEFLNFFAGQGPHLREAATKFVAKVQGNPNVTVLPQTRESFNAGVKLYSDRGDKGYSLTDCISMVRMNERGLTDALTSDHHFAQEGFQVLLRPTSD